jgi:hypothetical protein
MSFGQEVITERPQIPYSSDPVEPSQTDWPPVVFTGLATTTCSFQVNKVLPKKGKREHAGVTRFSLPPPLSRLSGAVGTWLGLP